MSKAASVLSPSALSKLIGTAKAPIVFDVCRKEALAKSDRMIAGVRWRDPTKVDQWAQQLPPAQDIVVACVHGHNVSQMTASYLRQKGMKARYLEGGTEGFLASGGLSRARRMDLPALQSSPSRWVTPERPGIDRLASAWFIRRFLDPDAEFHFVESTYVQDIADEWATFSLDVETSEFKSQTGENCLDSLLGAFGITDNDLQSLSGILSPADPSHPSESREYPGLQALWQGLMSTHDDDQILMEQGLLLIDALYAQTKSNATERR